jgi:hypothetical protein
MAGGIVLPGEITLPSVGMGTYEDDCPTFQSLSKLATTIMD